MSYKFLSTIQAISATFTGNSVYSNSTPNRTVKLDATGLYLSRISDGGYASTITADGSMYYNTRNNHIFQGDSSTKLTIVQASGNVLIGTTTDGSYKLDVNGTGRFTGTTNQITAYYDASNYMQLQHNSISVANTALLFNVNSAERMRLLSTGNLLIGTTTDAGYKLDVNGTFRVQYGTVERGAIFTHSNGTYAEIVLGNGSAAGVGVVEIHRNGTSAISLRSNAVLFNTSRLVTPSTFFVTGPYGGSSIGTSVRLASNTVDQGVYTATSGTQNTVVIGNSGNEIWQPSSGNATYNLFSVLPSINTSGTYAGIVRGFYYSPTLTSITGVTHRAIETVTGDVIFGSTSGNVGIGTTAPGGKLQVNGSVTASGAVARGTYITNTLVAAANNDVLVGLDITPTFTNGAFTGVSNIGLRVKDNNSGFDQIVTTRTLVTIGNTSNQSINAVNTLILSLPKTSGGGLIVQSNNSSTFGLTESPFINFNNVNGQTFARLNAVGTNGNLGRLEIGVAQPSTTISSGAFFYAAANRGTTQFALGSDFTDNSRAVIVSHWDGASALILKPNASTTTAPTLRVRNNADSGDNFLVYGATGNVGINVSSDAGYKLDVNGTARVQGQLEVLSTSSAQGLLLKHTALSTTATQIYYNSSDAVTYLDTLFSYTASQPFGSVNIRTKDSLNALTSRLYVEGNSGNVGIGTTTFLGKFQVGSGSATQFQVASSGASIYVGPSSGNYNMNITTNTIQSSNSGNTNTYLYIQPNGSGNVAMCSSGTNKVLIGTTTDAGYKLDVNGTARVITSLQVGNFTPGVAAASSTIFTTGRISASGGITFYNPSAGDNQDTGFKAGGYGVQIYISNGTVGSFGGYGSSTDPMLNLTSGFNPNSGSTNKTILLLNSTYQVSGTYSGGITGFLYNPSLTSITGIAYHRAIHTVTGDVLFGTTSGVVGIGTSTLSTEANLYLGAKSTIEGGQLVLQKGTSQTYATHLDNYNNQFRVMVGTDTGSTAAQLIVMHATGNVLINSGTDNGYKLQVAGNVNVNTGGNTNNLVVNADTSMFYNLTSGGGQVQSNVYTTSVTTKYTANGSSSVALFEWDPTLCQGVFVDYVVLVDGINRLRSGTLVIVNDNGGNVTITDNINSSVNGSSSAVTFTTAGMASIRLYCNNGYAASDVFVNIVTRYIPNIY